MYAITPYGAANHFLRGRCEDYDEAVEPRRRWETLDCPQASATVTLR